MVLLNVACFNPSEAKMQLRSDLLSHFSKTKISLHQQADKREYSLE